jgi:hypothetical protein
VSKVLAPFCGPTRTESDFLAHMQALIATDPQARRRHIVYDQLNTHQSESLVWLSWPTSQTSQRTWESKGRAAFLRQSDHKVVFHSRAIHSSWLNQIEIWLSILIRTLLKRGSFVSVDELEAKVLAFICYEGIS